MCFTFLPIFSFLQAKHSVSVKYISRKVGSAAKHKEDWSRMKKIGLDVIQFWVGFWLLLMGLGKATFFKSSGTLQAFSFFNFFFS